MFGKDQPHPPGVAVIGLDAAWRYRGDRNEDIQRALPLWSRVAKAIGLDPLSKQDVRLVADTIEHLMEGVVKMKPMPEIMKMKPLDAEVTLRGNKLDVVLH